MAVLYKKQKKEKVKAPKNPLTKFSDAVNNRSNVYKLHKVPFIQTKKEGGLIYKYGDGVKKVDTLKRTTKVIPNEKPKTRTDVYTDKIAFDKAFAAESDSLDLYNNAKNAFNKYNKIGDKFENHMSDEEWQKTSAEYGKLLESQEKKWHTFPYTDQSGAIYIPGYTANYPYKGTKSGLTIRPVGVEGFYREGYEFPRFKKPVVHNVYQPPPPEPEFIDPIQISYLPEKAEEPKIKLGSTQQEYMKIGWRFDPKTKLEVPVLLTHPGMKAKDGKRIFNKDIPSGGLPKNWEPNFDRPETAEKTDPYWIRKYVKQTK
jgi:hypothetical protein